MSDENKLSDSVHERLCAFLFDELDVEARTDFESELEQSETLRAELERMRSTVELVRGMGTERLSDESIESMVEAREEHKAPARLRFLPGTRATRIAAAFVLFLGAGLFLRSYLLPPLMPADSQAPYTYSLFGADEVARVDAPAAQELKLLEGLGYQGEAGQAGRQAGKKSRGKERDGLQALGIGGGPASPGPAASAQSSPATRQAENKTLRSRRAAPATEPVRELETASRLYRFEATEQDRSPGGAPEEVRRELLAQKNEVQENEVPKDKEERASEDALLALRAIGYVDDEEPAPAAAEQRVSLLPDLTRRLILGCRVLPDETPRGMFFRCWGEHPFVPVTPEDHLSTFSVDVDTASYVQSRHALLAGRLPAPGSVRTEEFVNYFQPDQPAPVGGETFALGLEMAPSRFASETRTNLLRVTLRGKDVEEYARQPLALTFVVDVSGSMRHESRLDNVKEALSLLVRKLDAGDSIALVAFNNEARLVSPMNSAASRGALENALFTLQPGGGTSVEAGLDLGFQTASDNLVSGAVNRVIFLSDGVGNIGETDQERILGSVEAFRAKSIYLNTIGVGLESHNDHFLEQLADRGDGVCNYIDSLGEAKKVMVDDFTKTLQPIARDVKIQIDFDPNEIESFRQLGYENRALRDDQFRDDAVDAGEVNAGHQVTALYEVVPRVGSTGAFLTARVRYKPPFSVDQGRAGAFAKEKAEVALEIEARLRWDQLAPSFEAASWGYRRATLVAQFAELLRQSVYARGEGVDELIRELEKLVRERRADPELEELLGLVRRARPDLQRIEKEYLSRPAWQATVDELRRLNYRIAQRELLHGTSDPGTMDEQAQARDTARSKDLETRLRKLLAEEGSENPSALEAQIEAYLNRGGDVQPEELEALRALGYGEQETPQLNPEQIRRLKELGYTER